MPLQMFESGERPRTGPANMGSWFVGFRRWEICSSTRRIGRSLGSVRTGCNRGWDSVSNSQAGGVGHTRQCCKRRTISANAVRRWIGDIISTCRCHSRSLQNDCIRQHITGVVSFVGRDLTSVDFHARLLPAMPIVQLGSWGQNGLPLPRNLGCWETQLFSTTRLIPVYVLALAFWKVTGQTSSVAARACRDCSQ